MTYERVFLFTFYPIYECEIYHYCKANGTLFIANDAL
jgi:hypothetical protein